MNTPDSHTTTTTTNTMSTSTTTMTTSTTSPPCAQGWIGERKGRGKGWGSRHDSSRAPGTLFFLFFGLYLYLEVQLRDPNNGVTVVWVLGLETHPRRRALVFFFTHTLQHSHDNTATSPHQQPMRKGPNDMRRVVWALCKFFFKYSFLFYMLIGIYRYYIDYNDNIWALWQVFFFKLFIVFSKLTTIVHSFSNVSKRRLHRRLGPGIILLHKTANTTTSTRPRHHSKPPAASSRGCMRA